MVDEQRDVHAALRGDLGQADGPVQPEPQLLVGNPARTGGIETIQTEVEEQCVGT